jgi:hypothetical protein
VTADLSRYDRDPDALEARWRKFSDDARLSGDGGNADLWTWLANGVRNELLGGSGCVTAAFDERRAGLPPVPDGESR